MLNRREFLLRSLLAGGATLLPPSLVWPHKKIFLPDAPKIYTPPHLFEVHGMDVAMEWDDAAQLYKISGESIAMLYAQLVSDIRKRGLAR